MQSKEKKNSDRHTSPAKKVSSTKQLTYIVVNEDSNKFHNLSNLDGNSNASVDEISSTTALVLKGNDAGPVQKSDEQQKMRKTAQHMLQTKTKPY